MTNKHTLTIRIKQCYEYAVSCLKIADLTGTKGKNNYTRCSYIIGACKLSRSNDLAVNKLLTISHIFCNNTHNLMQQNSVCLLLHH
jgi:hypothetical protein